MNSNTIKFMWLNGFKKILKHSYSPSANRSLRTRNLLSSIFIYLLFSLSSAAQESELWSASSSIDSKNTKVSYSALNTDRLAQILKEVETTGSAKLLIPSPEGELLQFNIRKSKVMAPGLQKKFPNIKTYSSINAHGETFKMVSTPKGIHAIAFTLKGEFRVATEDSSTNTYKSYYAKANSDVGINCSLEKHPHKTDQNSHQRNRDRFTQFTFGESLKKYRIALSAHATFTTRAGGVEEALSLLVTFLNATNAVYEKELGITFELVANNEQLITTASEPGPFQSSGSAGSNRFANQEFIDEVIGDENYDVGHFFGGDGGGGLAGVEIVCKTGSKATAGTSVLLTSSTIDNFIDIFLHELGHQFGATHTFTSADVCSLGSTAFTVRSAYEISSGSTIMSYAGLCNPNVTSRTDHYFHTISSQQILKFSNGNGNCAVEVPTGNTPPQVTIPESDFFIPINTPFVLTANGSDADGDDLTYCWEQFDKAPDAENPPGTPYSNPITGAVNIYYTEEEFRASDDYLTDEEIREAFTAQFPDLPEQQLEAIIQATINGRDNYIASLFVGDGPLFRSFPPTDENSRYFPQLSEIIAGNTSIEDSPFEILPFLERELNFVVSVRDNNSNGGGKTSEIIAFNSTTAAGPFIVTTEFSEAVYNGLSNVELSWDVAGTNEAPVNCQNLSILFSSDGGASFDAVLVESTANDGSTTFKLPNIATTEARIMVKAADNIFLNVNDRNFTIEPSTVDVPTDPTDLVASQSDESTIELNWSHSGDNENGFIVERSIGNTSDFEEIGTTTINETTFTDSSPSTSNSNNYRVAAFNETGNSAYSNIVTVGESQSNETDIISFSLNEQTTESVIDATDHSINVEVVIGTDVTSLVPVFTLSNGASSDVESGVARDFTNAVTYTITAEDGTTTQDWVVTVSVEPEDLSNETDIISFSFNEQTTEAVIDASDHSITVEVLTDTDISSLAPTFTLSEGASSDVESGVARDFTNAVTYTITAEDGTTTQDWIVTVSVEPEDLSNETDIISFSFNEQTTEAVIDATEHSIAVEVETGTDVTSMAPTFTLSEGASSDVESGVSRDFTNAAVYTITAEDGTTTQDWMVTVSVEASNETDITSFSFNEQTSEAVINNTDHTVLVEVIAGADVSSLAPAFTLSEGATSDVESGVARDFTNTQVYRITAEDQNTFQDWSITVSSEIVLSVIIEESLDVYPNPVDNILIVKSEEVVNVGLSDLKGKIVLPLREGKAFQFDMHDLNKGVYFLIIQNEGMRHYKKIMKN
ncbi:MAG: M12 family metallo-peptidase [bacterium]|nr:M12 family metallo-peptidase [bacterium]